MSSNQLVASEPKRKIVSLTLTNSCNLNCSYCYEKDKSNESMNFEVAKESIKQAFEDSNGFDEIEIDLFGGEPSLEKQLVKDIVEWTLVQKFSKPFIFFLQTNGTLIHGEFQDWLLKYRKYVNVGLSLDGTPKTHNKNRCNSYDKIDIEFFVKNYSQQGVRMTISNETAETLFEDVTHLHNLGFTRIDAFFALGIKWDQQVIEDKLNPQLLLLCNYYLDHPDINECEIFNIPISTIVNSKKIEKWCGTGVEMLSVGIDGKKYPCHSFQPNTTSNPIELGEIKFEEIKDYSDPECASCLFESLCPSCYGLNNIANGDILSRDKQHCNITKSKIMAVAYLRANQIAKGITSKIPSYALNNTIEAIKMINV